MKLTGTCILVFVMALLCFSGRAESSVYNKLVFADEFDQGSRPDTSKWSYETGYKRNHELQYYTDRAENAYLSDGCLHIVARADSAEVDGERRPVTSASLLTKGKFDFTYGRVEMRAKLPVALGTWPALWLMPVERAERGGWPGCGEIDIMENVGYEPERINYAIHTLNRNHMKKNGLGFHAFCADPEEFHVYALEWHPDRIEWYLDGRKRYVVKRPDGATWEDWPFDRPFYLIVNSAFGGGWGGTMGVAPEELPRDYVIDYIRIYQ